MDKHIKEDINRCSTCMEFQSIQPRNKIIPHETPGKSWEIIDAEIFTIINSHFLCIVHYQNKCSIVKMAEGLSTKQLIRSSRIVFAEYWLPSKITSDAGTNFLSADFKTF